MDLASYADLAVRLANTTAHGQDSPDGLATLESYRCLVADRPYLASRASAADLAALRLLRDEIRMIFSAASRRRDAAVVERLNALLTRHPLHQEIIRHDGGPWHLHLVDSGSAADKYAAGAIAGLTAVVAEAGVRRLGTCAAPGCERAFIDGAPAADSTYCDMCAPQASVRPLPARSRRSGHGPASTAAS